MPPLRGSTAGGDLLDGGCLRELGLDSTLPNSKLLSWTGEDPCRSDAQSLDADDGHDTCG